MSAFTEEELANMELVRTNIEGMSEHDIDKAVSTLSSDIVDLDLARSPAAGRIRSETKCRCTSTPFPI